MFLAFPLPAFGTDLIATDLTEKGIECYNRGDYDNAVHELSKALLVDPDNQEALQYLNKMGLNTGIYGTGETPASQTGKIAGKIVAYQQSLEDLEAEKQAIEKLNRALKTRLDNSQTKIRRQVKEKHRLRRMIQGMKKDARNRQKYIREVEASLDEKEQQVVQLNADLYDLAGYLDKRENLLDKEAENYKALQKSYRASQGRWIEEGLEYQKLLTEMEGKENWKEDGFLEAREGDKQKIKKLQEQLRRITEKRKEAEDQLHLIGEKLEMIDRGIGPEDQAKTGMGTGLTPMAASEKKPLPGERVALPGKDTREIRWIDRKDRVAADVKERMSRPPMPAASSGEAMEPGPADNTAPLKQQLQKTESRLDQTQSLLKEKDADNRSLQQRLRDAKERLGVVEGMLQEKEGQIKDLEKRLTDILSLPE